MSPAMGTGERWGDGYDDIVIWRCVLSAVCEKAGPVVRPFSFFREPAGLKVEAGRQRACLIDERWKSHARGAQLDTAPIIGM